MYSEVHSFPTVEKTLSINENIICKTRNLQKHGKLYNTQLPCEEIMEINENFWSKLKNKLFKKISNDVDAKRT